MEPLHLGPQMNLVGVQDGSTSSRGVLHVVAFAHRVMSEFLKVLGRSFFYRFFHIHSCLFERALGVFRFTSFKKINRPTRSVATAKIKMKRTQSIVVFNHTRQHKRIGNTASLKRKKATFTAKRSTKLRLMPTPSCSRLTI